MPEGLEAELYARAARRCVGRRIERVEIDDRQAAAERIRHELPAATVRAVRRTGKLVLVDTDGPTLGLHFGMAGRLVVDERAAIGRLEYGSGRDVSAWDRLVVTFAGNGSLRVNDPRRWAVFTLDPDEGRLGPDLLTVAGGHLAAAFARRRAAVKAVLLDQGVVAGLGNMCVDEVLWQAGLSPIRPASTITAGEVDGLVAAMRLHLPAMLVRGGSHTGTIDPEVRAGLPPCPRDGNPLRRDRVGGRTTIWCPAHQA